MSLSIPAIVGRTAGLIVFSTAAGAVIGALTACRLPGGPIFGSMIGAPSGLLLSPVIFVCRWKTPLGRTLPAVFLVPAAVAMGCSLLDTVVGTAVSAFAYTTSAIVAMLYSAIPDSPGPSGRCAQCRYDRHGLPDGAACPECGVAVR